MKFAKNRCGKKQQQKKNKKTNTVVVKADIIRMDAFFIRFCIYRGETNNNEKTALTSSNLYSLCKDNSLEKPKKVLQFFFFLTEYVTTYKSIKSKPF